MVLSYPNTWSHKSRPTVTAGGIPWQTFLFISHCVRLTCVITLAFCTPQLPPGSRLCFAKCNSPATRTRRGPVFFLKFKIKTAKESLLYNLWLHLFVHTADTDSTRTSVCLWCFNVLGSSRSDVERARGEKVTAVRPKFSFSCKKFAQAHLSSCSITQTNTASCWMEVVSNKVF